ncbi:pleiotropic regulatory protein RsmS [Pseudoalteromonas sp. SSDWG2]|uniref:pleiotropic regulatory protein RsmS n=1 Tax=Pseudoalteromonas sp. SSDWG2 TaxID=3139391 RepID=UPI003BAC8AA0
MQNTDKPLDSAPDDVKLAVDLIMLLEQHEVDPHVALSAIEIVKRDLQTKVQQQHQC